MGGVGGHMTPNRRVEKHKKISTVSSSNLVKWAGFPRPTHTKPVREREVLARAKPDRFFGKIF
jgi:hypothetical protein